MLALRNWNYLPSSGSNVMKVLPEINIKFTDSQRCPKSLVSQIANQQTPFASGWASTAGSSRHTVLQFVESTPYPDFYVHCNYLNTPFRLRATILRTVTSTHVSLDGFTSILRTPFLPSDIFFFFAFPLNVDFFSATHDRVEISPDNQDSVSECSRRRFTPEKRREASNRNNWRQFLDDQSIGPRGSRANARNLFYSVKYLNGESKFQVEGNFGYFATARRQSQQRDRENVVERKYVRATLFSSSHSEST